MNFQNERHQYFTAAGDGVALVSCWFRSLSLYVCVRMSCIHCCWRWFRHYSSFIYHIMEKYTRQTTSSEIIPQRLTQWQKNQIRTLSWFAIRCCFLRLCADTGHSCLPHYWRISSTCTAVSLILIFIFVSSAFYLLSFAKQWNCTDTRFKHCSNIQFINKIMAKQMGRRAS